VRRSIWLLAAAAALLLAGNASAFTRQDVTVTTTDGTPIGATLWLPSDTPPQGGWPAIVLFHGLGGSREDMNRLAEQAFLPGDRFAVLAYDARGHGRSGGLVGIDGPREVSDARAMFEWLRDRPDVSDTQIGAFGISYGGGAVLNSLVAGVPWAAVEVCEAWTDLAAALAPQGLAKSGVIAGFLNELPVAKLDPTVLALRDAAFAGNLAPARQFLADRSSLAKLRGVTTPVFFMQGRRDFAFGLDQALAAWPLLAGPKHLWIGLHGHAPSTFPAPDTPAMLLEGRQWFEHYLAGVVNGIERKPAVEVAPVAWKGRTRGYASPGRIRGVGVTAGFEVFGKGARKALTIGPSGRILLGAGTAGVANPLPAARRGYDVYGSPTVQVTATASGGWSRLVAVLTARTTAGKTIVVSAGGVPTRPGTHAYSVRMISQMTFVPPGARLSVTLGSSSLAQDPGDLLYLQLPMPAGARLALTGTPTLRLTTLAPGVR
jgi:pimeloyl-ACP methyl ester carboxylesterase